MKKILAIALALGVGFSGLFSLNAEAKACRSRRFHYVSSHLRRITTNKNGTKRNRVVHVRSHMSH